MNKTRHSNTPLVGWLRSTGLAFAALIYLGAPLPAQEDTEVRWYDLRSLLAAGAEDPEEVDLRLHLQTSYLDNLEPDSYGVRQEKTLNLDSDDWSDVIRLALNGEFDDDSNELDARSGMLKVTADARVHERVAGILGDLKRQVLAPIELEIFVLPAAAIPAGTAPVLTAQEVTALLTAVEPLDHSRKTARLGQRLRLGAEGKAATMYDYDVEVATKARAADPSVTVLHEGTALGAVARPRPGGGYFLRVWGRRGTQADSPRTARLGNLAAAPLELPAMNTSLAVSSAAIAEGGGLLLGQDWNEDGVWLVRTRRPESSTTASAERSDFIPLGELAAKPLQVEAPWLPRTDPSGGWARPDGSLLEQLRDEIWDAAQEPEELVEQLREERDRLELGGSVQLVDNALYVRGSEPLLALAKRRVRQLGQGLANETVEVEVRLALVERQEARRMAETLSPEELAARLEHRLMGACRLGDTLIVLGGTERFYLLDYDTEIAEAASVQDPIIGNRFEGVSLWCQPNRGADGVLSTWVDLQVQKDTRGLRMHALAHWSPRNPEQSEDDPIPVGTFGLDSYLELPATARAEVRSLSQLSEGRWTFLCCTGLSETESSLIAVVKATTRGDR